MNKTHSLARRRTTPPPYQWVTIVHCAGCILWVLALCLPAVATFGFLRGPEPAPDDLFTLVGWQCFVATFNPLAFLVAPYLLPLLFVNCGTLLAPVLFIDGKRNGLPFLIVVSGYVSLLIAILVMTMIDKILIGSVCWITSISFLTVSLHLICIQQSQPVSG